MPNLRTRTLAATGLCALLTAALSLLAMASPPAAEGMRLGLLIAALLAMAATVLGAGVALALRRQLPRLLAEARAIAGGQLDDQQAAPGRGELGELAQALRDITRRMRHLLRAAGQDATAIAGEAIDLAATAAELITSSKQTNAKSATVASSAVEMSVNMEQMARSTADLSANFKTVAAAVEEMTASIAEVGRNTDHAAAVAKQAESLAEISNRGVAQLEMAAEEVGKVVQVIEEIAEQTNLLALNATIEAARAGESGRGFAVVATEVKDLARQTAEATGDIRKRIAHIQSASREAVVNMGQIGEAITEVNGASRSIAAAVEEQGVATREIASSVAHSATASTAVSDGVAQCAVASQEITQAIADVSAESERNARSAGLLDQASAALGKLGDDLIGVMREFHRRADGFDLLGFQQGHIAWKKRLADVLAGRTRLAPSEVSDHHQCALGKWCDGTGQANWSRLGTFQRLVGEHETFHQLARSVTDAASQEQWHDAHDRYARLTEQSVTVVQLLQLLGDESAAPAARG